MELSDWFLCFVEQASCHGLAGGVFLHHSKWLTEERRDIVATAGAPKYIFSMH